MAVCKLLECDNNQQSFTLYKSLNYSDMYIN